MVYTVLFPKWWFRVQLTHAPSEKQPQRGNTTFLEQLRATCPTLADAKHAHYVPSWVLPHGDMQTIYLYTQHYKPGGCAVDFQREIFEFADGGRAAVDWALPRRDAQQDAPLVILIPGIAGCSSDFYARSLISKISRPPYDYQVVVLHSRGVSGVPLATPLAFHGGMTQDIREFVEHVARLRPCAPLIGVGFSLGANMLTKYVGEEGEGCRLVAAASVCNPYDIQATVHSMCVPSLKNRYLYAAALTRSLVQVFAANEQVIMAGPVALDAEAIHKARNIDEFNEAYTARVFGYESAEQLNISGSSVHYLKHIRTPMLFINALDDPMCYRHTIPFDEIESNPYLVLACTRYGGHLAYYEGPGLTPWLPTQLAQFVHGMLAWK
ncbi:medium-chain fatty acid ethyl ester synthase/esterase 2 [Coemansia sp. RSA 2607]|nr:medium-chain fatty acid ethyl ester synthase/esterase 2 [Coemansia sp. RSA 2607]